MRLRHAAGALALAATLGVASPASADVAAVSFDGEAGTLAGVSASAGATVTPAAARHGSNGLDVAGTAAPAYARWNPDVVPQGHTHATARLWVRLLSRGAGESVDLFTIQNARRTENFDLFVNGITGQLQWDLYRANEDHTDAPMQLNRWYLVEVQVEFAGGEYTARVRLDGVDQGTIASSYPSTTVRSVIVGSEPAKTHHQQYDDLVVRVGDAATGWPVTTTPQVTVTTPVDGATFARGASVPSAFQCVGPDFAVVTCTGPATVDTSTVGPHTFTVTATDTAGQQTVVNRSYTVVDETDPTVDLVTPAEGATFARGVTVTPEFSCADDVGVVSCDGPSAVDTSTLGPHQFTVTATDAAGNTGVVTHTYTVVDATDPTVQLVTPADGATFAQGAVIAPDFSCADDVGVVSCEGPSAVDTSTLGAHQFTVTATDAAGNTGVVTHTYTVADVTDPVVELRRPVDGATYGRGEVVEVDLACDDEPGGSGVASCTGTRPSGAAIDTSTLGQHTFTATAVDGAGNSTSVTHTYTVVDRTSPTVQLAAPADGAAYARGDLVLADFTCFDEVGGGGLRPFGSCVGPVAVDAPVDTWTLGSHDFTVTATDAAGNVGWTTNTYEVLDNQPDNQIANAAVGRWVGDDVHNAIGRGQTREARVARGSAVTYLVRVQNDTGATDRFEVQGGRSDRRWSVRYRTGGRDVTGRVTAGRYVVGPLAPGEAVVLRVVVRPTRFAQRGDQHVLAVSSSARNPGTARDTVVAVTRRA